MANLTSSIFKPVKLASWILQQNGFNQFTYKLTFKVLTIDTSLTGWQMLWRRGTVRGLVPSTEDGTYSCPGTVDLKHFLLFLKNKHVLLRSDSTCIAFHINHQEWHQVTPILTADTADFRAGLPLSSLFLGHPPLQDAEPVDFLS